MKTYSNKNICALALILFTVIGCGKYEDGPWMSTHSALYRLYGTYHVVYFSKNDVDITQHWKDSCDWTFKFYDSDATREVEDVFYYEGKYFKDSIEYKMYLHTSFSLQNHDMSLWLSMLSYQIYPYGTMGNDSIGIFPFQIGGMRTFRITRLTETELWLKYEDGDEVYKIKMEEF